MSLSKFWRKRALHKRRMPDSVEDKFQLHRLRCLLNVNSLEELRAEVNEHIKRRNREYTPGSKPWPTLECIHVHDCFGPVLIVEGLCSDACDWRYTLDEENTLDAECTRSEPFVALVEDTSKTHAARF